MKDNIYFEVGDRFRLDQNIFTVLTAGLGDRQRCIEYLDNKGAQHHLCNPVDSGAVFTPRQKIILLIPKGIKQDVKGEVNEE